VAGFCEYGNEPSGSIKKAGCYLTSWVTISFSKNILHHEVSGVLLPFRVPDWKRCIHQCPSTASQSAPYKKSLEVPRSQAEGTHDSPSHDRLYTPSHFVLDTAQSRYESHFTPTLCIAFSFELNETLCPSARLNVTNSAYTRGLQTQNIDQVFIPSTLKLKFLKAQSAMLLATAGNAKRNVANREQRLLNNYR
jgi:hypothetical protein